MMISPWRNDLLERLLGILLESIPFEIPGEVQRSLLEEPSGSWILPTPISTPKFGGQWMNASLHWMWQEETETCCLNFLANEGHLEWGIAMQGFQWTLEASHPYCSGNLISQSQSTSSMYTGETECRRFEPTPVITSTCEASNIPVQTFWKIGSLQTLGIEWRLLSLMGRLESWNQQRLVLSPHARFSCEQICSHTSPTTHSSRYWQSQENVRLAQFLQYLETISTPQLVWHAPPPTSTRAGHGNPSFHTLADLFRFAYTWLEDQRATTSSASKEATAKTPTTACHTEPSDSSRILPSINVRKSIGDSLAISGGLAATGASFISPIGVAVSVAAIGVKDGIAIAAHKGKETRNGDGYRFGDVARGVVATIKEQRSNKSMPNTIDAFLSDDPQNDHTSSPHSFPETSQKSLRTTQSIPTQDHKARYAGVVGSSIGAAAGLALAGPIGFVAGSLIGGTTTQHAMRQQQRLQEETLPTGQGQDFPAHHLPDNAQNQSSAAWDSNSGFSNPDTRERHHSSTNPAIPAHEKTWRLGDNLRNAVQRGKEINGRDASSDYQFGDLTRGLFSRRK